MYIKYAVCYKVIKIYMYASIMSTVNRPYVTLSDVKEAYSRIKSIVKKTPVFQDNDFDEKYGRKFYFKAESMQKTGAFKIRGALNAVLTLREKGENIIGLVTHSSGNHGRAMAWIAQRFNLPCVVVCPTTVPEAKLQIIRNLGSEIVPCEPTLDDRLRKVGQIQNERGYTYISTCDDYTVMAGQGTIALEFLEQVPDLDAILVPVSGGGMAAGICVAAKSINPNIKIFAVEPEGKELQKSLVAGERLWPNPPKCLDTVADGMRMQQLGTKTWPIILDLAEKHVFTVTDEEAIEGMKYAFEYMKLVVEPSAGTAIAAAMSRDLKNVVPGPSRNVGVILCGGNVDIHNLPF